MKKAFFLILITISINVYAQTGLTDGIVASMFTAYSEAILYGKNIDKETLDKYLKLSQKLIEGKKLSDKETLIWNDVKVMTLEEYMNERNSLYAALNDDGLDELRDSLKSKERELSLLRLQLTSAELSPNLLQRFSRKSKAVKEYEEECRQALYSIPKPKDIDSMALKLREFGFKFPKENVQLRDSIRGCVYGFRTRQEKFVAAYKDTIKLLYNIKTQLQLEKEGLIKQYQEFPAKLDEIVAQRYSGDGTYTKDDWFDTYTYKYETVDGKHIANGPCVIRLLKKQGDFEHLNFEEYTHDITINLKVEHGKLIDYKVSGTIKHWNLNPEWKKEAEKYYDTGVVKSKIKFINAAKKGVVCIGTKAATASNNTVVPDAIDEFLKGHLSETVSEAKEKAIRDWFYPDYDPVSEFTKTLDNTRIEEITR